MPDMHVVPRAQDISGMQHGMPALPQPTGTVHVPPMQRSAPELPHALDPSQHGAPSTPHAVHVPPIHAKPERQTSPEQHASPAAPQPATGVVHAAPVHASPGTQSLEPMHVPPSGV
jgi:hypothetical protein